MRATQNLTWFSTAMLALATSPVLAKDLPNNAYVGGIATATYQVASKPYAKNDASAQFLIETAKEMKTGTWRMDLIGNTSPRKHGVSRYFDSNDMVGYTTDDDQKGRIVASQLYWSSTNAAGEFNIGLLNPDEWIAANQVSNNKYKQFMASSFVTDPTLDSPSSALALNYIGNLSEHANFMLYVSSNSGIEENDHSYGNAFNVGGHNDDGHKKGVFTNTELTWAYDNAWLRGGLWYDTGRYDRVDQNSGSAHRYGAYLLIGQKFGPGTFELRAGVASDHASENSSFQALAIEIPINDNKPNESTLGLAFGRTAHPDEVASSATFQAEAYWRFNVIDSVYVSPDFQYLRHAVKKNGQGNHSGKAYIAGLRLGIEF